MVTYTQTLAALRGDLARIEGKLDRVLAASLTSDEVGRLVADMIAQHADAGGQSTLPPTTEPPATEPPVITTPAPLGMVVPYKAGVAIYSSTYPKFTGKLTYTPGAWTSLGLTAYFGDPGERGELGIEHDATAEAVISGDYTNPEALAKATATLPIHNALIDGHFIDILKYPTASFDERENPNPYFSKANAAGITMDQAHFPALPNYVMFLKTGDIQYLKNQQAVASFLLAMPPNSWAMKKGIAFPHETRAMCWTLREVFKAYFATLHAEKTAPVTAPCLPSYYWKNVLDNNLAWMQQEYLGTPVVMLGIDSQAKQRAVLGKSVGIVGSATADGTGDIALYQQDYLCIVLGWAVSTGLVPEWKPTYEAIAKQLVIRGTGPLRSQALQYWLWIKGAVDWSGLLAVNKLSPTADGNLPAWTKTEAPHYAGSFRMAAYFAVKNGIPSAWAAYSYMDEQAKRIGFIAPRYSVAV